ncbi:hypothetical protein HPB48_007187 [Haemaphysalis longicornis]|uniref:Uncharacterized protein n=1 Tax=Haemaphysalis longicornis TaxID=44386 RepID=A0A9J6G3U6_HAELO|nr:hypothetical protein HPB48_007187 [Haemaphysalis longicornis]
MCTLQFASVENGHILNHHRFFVAFAVWGKFTFPLRAHQRRSICNRKNLQRHCSLSPRSADSFETVYTKLRGEHQHVGVKETCSKTSEYTGVSFRKILDIKSKAKATGGKLTTPSRKRPGSENRKRRTAMYDSFTFATSLLLQQKIAEEFRRSEHLPSLRTWTIRRLLSDTGFVFEKRERNSMMIERQDVLIWRQRYLRQVAEYRQQHRKTSAERRVGFSDHVEPIIISLGEEDDDSCGSADDDLSGIQQME